jgi:phosphoribosylamine--glycine ligase
VILASGGYPGSYTSGKEIRGLENVRTAVFHAGTRKGDGDGFLTAGGRVLGVTALAPTLADARDRAYAAVKQIHFDGAQYRTDIAAKGL